MPKTKKTKSPDEPSYEELSVEDLRQFKKVYEYFDRNPASNLKDMGRPLKEALYNSSLKVAGVRDALHEVREGIVTFTEAGKRLYKCARFVLKTVDWALAQPSDEEWLTIFSGPGFAARFLPHFLEKYLTNKPHFRHIWLQEEGEPEAVLHAVRVGYADIGITVSRDDTGLQKNDLLNAKRVIMCGEKHKDRQRLLRGQPKDLCDSILITYPPDVLQEAGFSVFPKPSGRGVRIYTERENTIRGWMESGIAIGHGAVAQTVPNPPGIAPIMLELEQLQTWSAYTRGEVAEDVHQKNVRKVLGAMKEEAAARMKQAHASGY